MNKRLQGRGYIEALLKGAHQKVTSILDLDAEPAPTPSCELGAYEITGIDRSEGSSEIIKLVSNATNPVE